MTGKTISRRSFLGGMVGCAVGTVLGAQVPVQAAQLLAAGQKVPHSAGTAGPNFKMPLYATDCHHHIYDARYPLAPGAVLTPPDATVAEYRLLQQRLGIMRHVIVQPSTYGVDNSLLVDSLKEFGLDTSRGIAVVDTKVTDQELHKLNAAGVRGIRFNFSIAKGVTDVGMVLPLAHRIHELGWHVQVVAKADQIVKEQAIWEKIPCPIVFDHLGHVPRVTHAAFNVILAMLQQKKCWVKLSGAYILSKTGAPSYMDRYAVAKEYVDTAPDQVVWGSDWPHPTAAADKKPDDAVLLNLLADWAPEKSVRKRILVDNPARLYGFSK